MGIGDKTYVTFADGGIFSDFSEEFQTLSDAGEDVIYVHEGKHIAVNKEVYTDENLAKLGIAKEELVEKKAIETGNIFHLGTRFSDAIGLTFKDEDGTTKPVVMGSYGIGPTRLMGTLVEVLSDEKGIVWPKEVAPFALHLVSLTGKSDEVQKEAQHVYDELVSHGVSVLWDDRDVRAGEKFADSDLIGIPMRLVVSERSLAEGGYELVERATGNSSLVPESALLDVCTRL